MPSPAINTVEQRPFVEHWHAVVSNAPPLPPSTYSDVTSTSTYTVKTYHNRSSVVNSPFKRVSQGFKWRAPTAYSHSRRALVYLDSAGTSDRVIRGVRYLKKTDCWFPQLLEPPIFPASIPNGMYNEAETKALLNLQGQNVHLGNFFGELKQTIRMFETTALRLSKAIRKEFWQNKHRQFRHIFFSENGPTPRQIQCSRQGRVSRSLTSSADLWLEFIYGWSPLLADLKGMLDELLNEARPPVVNATGNSRRRLEHDAFNYDSSAHENGGSRHIRGVSRSDVQCRVSLWYSLRDAAKARASRLGLVNPLETVWEVTRFSFVIDWFLPIGPWLQTWCADSGWDFLSGSRSTKIETTRVITEAYEDDWVDPRKVPFPFPGVAYDCHSLSRTVYNASPSPGLYFKSPLSGIHVANATALLLGLLKH